MEFLKLNILTARVARSVSAVLALSLGLSACDSASDTATVDNNALNAESRQSSQVVQQYSDLFNDRTASFREILNSEQAQAIARSFPVPELPDTPTSFQTEADQRFEQWTLSSMTRSTASGSWVWNEQQFLRIAIDDADALADAEDSNWRFRDVMLQRFQRYDFATGLQISDSVAERRALSLADVTDNTLFVHDVVASIETTDCASTITLTRPGDITAGDTMQWRSSECPERFRIGDTLFSGTRTAGANDVRWVTHAYGQLPSLAGVVLIEQLELIISADEELRINRSRRRSGSGPVTVSASLFQKDRVQELRDVQWRMDFRDGALFPEALDIEVPSLSRSFSIAVPQAFEQGFNNDALGMRHGVLATENDASIPGILTLYPRSLESP